MCLWTKQIKPLVAEEPIIAYKLLIHTINNKFISPYQEYDYTEYINNNEIVKDAIPRAIKPNNVGEILEDIMGLKKVCEGIHLFAKKMKHSFQLNVLDLVLYLNAKYLQVLIIL